MLSFIAMEWYSWVMLIVTAVIVVAYFIYRNKMMS